MLVLVLLAIMMLIPQPSNALHPKLRDGWQAAAIDMYAGEVKYKYKLGGKIKDGELDCSLFVEESAIRAHVIEKPDRDERTQAWRIYRGLDGFTAEAVIPASMNPQKADVLCLAVPGSLQRPYGINHVGLIIFWKNQWCVIDANSKTGGIRIMPIQGLWTKFLPLDGHRRLIVGD